MRRTVLIAIALFTSLGCQPSKLSDKERAAWDDLHRSQQSTWRSWHEAGKRASHLEVHAEFERVITEKGLVHNYISFLSGAVEKCLEDVQ